MPMTGIATARAACQAMRTATGRIAGPERPPVPKARRGLRVSTSIARPSRVLMQERASAPASAHARAKTAMSPTLGESFGITGSRVAFRTALHDLVGHHGVAAEGHPALLDVRARDVDLEPVHAGRAVEDPRHLGVLLDGVAAHVHEHRRVVLRQPGQHVPDERLHPDALAGRSRSAARRASPRCAGSGSRRAARGRGPWTRGRPGARGRAGPRTRRRSRRCPRPRSAGS